MDHAAPAHVGVARWIPIRVHTLVALAVAVVVIVARWPLAAWAAQQVGAAPLVALAFTALLLLPGLALLRLFWPGALAPIECWPLAAGLSLALLPLLLLASMPLGLRWNGALAWGFLALCSVVVAWPRPDVALRDRLRPWLMPENALLLALTLAAVVARLYAARDLPVGMFGDSYHHTIITQLLVDHGGLFSSWQPYAPLKTFTYHYGFHSGVAWLHWLSGVPVPRGLLVVGQVQSALAVPLAYLFTRRVLRNEAAAFWAALLVGFVSLMPAYYVNWGRYTQLTGQLILSAVCVCWMALLELRKQAPGARSQGAKEPRSQGAQRAAVVRPSSIVYRLSSSLRLVLLTSLATAGLILTHYRVAVFAACFVAVYGVYLLLTQVRSWRAFARLAARGLIAGGLAVLLVVPWLLRLRESALLRIGQYYMSQNIGADQANALPTLNDYLVNYAGHGLAQLALLGLVLLLLARQWRALLIAFWAGLVWVAANPYLVGLNGAGIISNFAVLVASYLVLAPLAGAAPAVLSAWLAPRLGAARVVTAGQIIAGALVVLWGLGWQQSVFDARFQLFTNADRAAMDWIRRETPPDARFFVNSFPAYGDTIYAGSDGGWWLPFITGRQSNLPPITHGTEVGEQPNYQLTVTEQNRRLESQPIDTAAAAEALRAAGYSYLYDGPAATEPGPEFVDPAALAQSPWYELVYSKDGATIWKIK